MAVAPCCGLAVAGLRRAAARAPAGSLFSSILFIVYSHCALMTHSQRATHQMPRADLNTQHTATRERQETDTDKNARSSKEEEMSVSMNR